MLYYVQTGDISTSTMADSPRQAAIQAIKYSEEMPGVCVIVSKEEILKEYSDSHFYFFTDSIMDTGPTMRLVY